MNVDIAIVGAGPAGLCLARALAAPDRSMAVIDPATEDVLAEPEWDGREIALTHASKTVLDRLGLWSRIDADQISALRDAEVTDGNSTHPMRIDHSDGRAEQLGWLVSNHLIRRAAWQVARECEGLTWLTGRRVEATSDQGQARRLRLSDGTQLEAGVVVAADGRFSATRRAAGISAHMRDFGKSMLVTRMTLEQPHEHIAREWFGHDFTLALLPLNGQQASTVVTLPHERIERLMSLEEADFNREITELYRHRHGQMQLVGKRHAYPLVGVMPDRLTAPRLVCVGDAAVGMHPVTAHGFNLGLTGVRILTDEIAKSRLRSGVTLSPRAMAAYAARLRAHSVPLYLATNTIVSLYTSDRLPARILRRAALRTAAGVAPFRRAIAGQLTGRSGPLQVLAGR
ncbi:MAG: 5-demethoxyubiquinol-8 5-hydroxylase UbiM [Pseudomonadota bacterium]|nr:MAG: 5-demethoxyubiquinol-8 5-hydroxylase UbiM [Pseudomonadota bacterium]